jgi:hypothetical protein
VLQKPLSVAEDHNALTSEKDFDDNVKYLDGAGQVLAYHNVQHHENVMS